MRILMVVTNADLAGAPVHVRDLALGLLARGFNLHVVFGDDGPICDQLTQAGIATSCVPTLRSNINPWQDWQSFKTLCAIVNSVKPTVLHLHSSKAGLVGRLVAWRLALPAVYTVHGWGFGPGRRKVVSLFVRMTEWLCRPLTARYIAVSETDHLMGMSHLSIKPDTIQTIYNGSAFVAGPHTANPGCMVVVMVARNDHPKDYTTLFRALAKANFDEAILVGKGTDAEAFKNQAQNILGPKVDRLKFLGASSQVEALLAQANVMVLSSRFEGLPISLIEGMSKGLVLLASRVGGVPELVQVGVNGFLFDAGDDEALAAHLNNLYQNPHLRQSMGAASLQRFTADFELDAMVEKTIEQYRLACS
jgi:glycosyltransferase involved in cell wall biosynthesis